MHDFPVFPGGGGGGGAGRESADSTFLNFRKTKERWNF